MKNKETKNNEYRKEATQLESDVKWSILKFLPAFLLTVITLAVVLFSINSSVKYGSTFVERKVFENSYQRSEGIKSGIAVFEAQLIQIDIKLTDGSLSSSDRFELISKKAALDMQISTLRGKL